MNLRTLSVTQAVAATGMKRDAIYRLLESGQVAGNRNGANWIISEESLHAWIHRTPTAPPIAKSTRAFPEVEPVFS